MSSTAKEKEKAQRHTQLEAIGRRWCSQRMHEVDIDQGSEVLKGRTKRWICFACQEATRLRLSAKK